MSADITASDAPQQAGAAASTDADRLSTKVTPLVITFNEEANLPRTLASLHWARRIVLVDSGSTDSTLAIAAADRRVQVYHRQFDGFASQCMFGLAQIKTEWALSIDADYELSVDLIAELHTLRLDDGTAGYSAPFVYCIHGRPLRGSLYPPRTVLYRRHLAQYRNEGHGHRVSISGPVACLRSSVRHDDRKPLSNWLASQLKYASVEAEHLLRCSRSELRAQDRLRLVGWPAPFVVLIYVLFGKGCILDGKAGLHYALQRMLAEVLLALELVDRRFSASVDRRRIEG